MYIVDLINVLSHEYFGHKTKREKCMYSVNYLSPVLFCGLVYRETYAPLVNYRIRASIQAIKINNTYIYIKVGMHYLAALILGLVCSYLRGFMSILK